MLFCVGLFSQNPNVINAIESEFLSKKLQYQYVQSTNEWETKTIEKSVYSIDDVFVVDSARDTKEHKTYFLFQATLSVDSSCYVEKQRGCWGYRLTRNYDYDNGIVHINQSEILSTFFSSVKELDGCSVLSDAECSRGKVKSEFGSSFYEAPVNIDGKRGGNQYLRLDKQGNVKDKSWSLLKSGTKIKVIGIVIWHQSSEGDRGIYYASLTNAEEIK